MRPAVWENLANHYLKEVKPQHLRDLLADEKRNDALLFEFNKILLDLSHEKMNEKTLDHFEQLAKDLNIYSRVEQMFRGDVINTTEKRAALHVALRSSVTQKIVSQGKDVVPDVHNVLNRIEKFTEDVRSFKARGFLGRPLTSTLVIGIGGSYLGIEFLHEAFRSSAAGQSATKGRKIRFIANVDPLDFNRAVEGLNVEETLVVVNSKTFTTAETMLNAKTVKNWLISEHRKLGVQVNTEEDIKKICSAHMCAVSTNLAETSKWGISDDRVFGFWDWVGGRFSCWSAIGVLPLSLHYGFPIMKQFLEGGHSVDEHFLNTKSVKNNLPMLLGFIGFYNTTICGFNSRAILPYCQALCKMVPHIQQLDMESNGKRVSISGETLPYECTVVNFGEPGTNGQHSFYQLLHQGRVIPGEFIGFSKNQAPVFLDGEPVTNHEELMSNYFSQPDALAYGKTEKQLEEEKCPKELIAHKFFPGDRPSLSFLFPELTPFTCGQLLALYEHRTTVEGFLWDINSYDQWGVELGKILAKQVRTFFQKHHGTAQANFEGTTFNTGTKNLLKRFVADK